MHKYSLVIQCQTCIFILCVCVLGAIARTGARFGQGSGAIVMNNVRCRGSEQKLHQCPHDSLVFGCYHYRDAGVECIAGELSASVLLLLILMWRLF